MDIGKVNLLNLWVETLLGEVSEVDLRDGTSAPVETHPIAGCRFPLEVRTTYYQRRESDGFYGGKNEIYCYTSTTNSEGLLIAMAYRPWWRQLWRRRTVYSLHDAMIIVSTACERCLNALHYEYGVPGGYPEFSDQWYRCGTCCVMCRDLCPAATCRCNKMSPQPVEFDPDIPSAVMVPGLLLDRGER